MFDPFPSDPRLHEPRRSSTGDHLRMPRRVVAVRMRDKGERLRIGRIQPQVVGGQMNTAAITNVDHEHDYCAISTTRFQRANDLSKPVERPGFGVVPSVDTAPACRLVSTPNEKTPPDARVAGTRCDD